MLENTFSSSGKNNNEEKINKSNQEEKNNSLNDSVLSCLREVQYNHNS